MTTRVEHDSLGEKIIPNDKYYGVQTVRAMENFAISGIPISHYPSIIYGLIAVKQACAKANLDLGLLDPKIADAIIAATEEILDEKKFHDQFPIDVIQGGAGTSANMNANEVLANRALEILGHQKGEYQHVHPNNHVNLSQSTNDVYPTAIKVALVKSATTLLKEMTALRDACFQKATEFKDVIKMGRTQLQDAVPMTLGQEFHAYATTITEDIERVNEAITFCHEINLGATAIGTGINTKEGYADLACQCLAELTNMPFVKASDLVEATSDTGVFVTLSSMFKRFAVKMTKICNDLRLLSSGPQAGFGDISLPAVQPGSSIMPGKVNPVIPEVMNQICFQVMGNDTVVTMAASGGQLQLNAFEPVIAYNTLQSIHWLAAGCKTLRKFCIVDIKANIERCENSVKSSAGLITAFAPYIGYEAAAKIAKKVIKSDKTVYELVQESGLLSQEKIEQILSPKNMTHPNLCND